MQTFSSPLLLACLHFRHSPRTTQILGPVLHSTKGHSSIPTVNYITIIPRHDKQSLSTPHSPCRKKLSYGRIQVGSAILSVSKNPASKFRKHTAHAPTHVSLLGWHPLYFSGAPSLCAVPEQPTPALKPQYVPPRLCSPFAVDLQHPSLQPLSHLHDAICQGSLRALPHPSTTPQRTSWRL